MTREELKTEVMGWTPALLGMGKECTDRTLEAQKAIVDMLEHQPQGDLISREAVLEIVNSIKDCISIDGYWAILERVKALSPVEPQQVPIRGYICDPRKNKECRKTACYQRGGPCRITLNPEYAKEE